MDESLQTFVDALHKADDGKTLLIVEGKNDVKALQQARIDAVKELDTQLYLFCENVAARWKRAVLLTDLDAEGKRLYGKLKGYLTRMGVFIDEGPRDALWNTDLRQVEGLFFKLEE